MNKLLLLALPLLVVAASDAPAQNAKTCSNQYADAEGVNAAGLLTSGFEIKAAIPGGLWLQKAKEIYYCTTLRVADTQVVCWTLRVPVTGQPCE